MVKEFNQLMSPETIAYYANADIAVLRNGKAKKNDPPIPADLAPISGSGKRVRKEPQEERMFLDPIKFRYSTETVVDEPEEPVQPAEEPAEAKASRRRRNRKPQGERTEQPKAEAPKPEKEKKAEPKAEKKPEPKPEQKETAEGGDEQAKKRRRPNYRRHRKPKQNTEG